MKTTIFLILLMALMASCTPPDTSLTKVVILEVRPRIHMDYITYKVKILDYSTVGYVSLYNEFDPGDTIVVKRCEISIN
jgi:hypothetical protein